MSRKEKVIYGREHSFDIDRFHNKKSNFDFTSNIIIPRISKKTIGNIFDMNFDIKRNFTRPIDPTTIAIPKSKRSDHVYNLDPNLYKRFIEKNIYRFESKKITKNNQESVIEGEFKVVP